MKSYTKNWLSLTVILAVTFGLFFLTVTRVMNRMESDVAKSKAITKVENVSDKYSNFLSAIQQDLNGLNKFGLADKEKLGEYLASLRQSNPAYKELAFYDQYGNLVFNTDIPPLANKDLLQINSPSIRHINRQNCLIIHKEYIQDGVKKGNVIAIIDDKATGKWLGNNAYLWIEGKPLLTGSPQLPSTPRLLEPQGVKRFTEDKLLGWKKVNEREIIGVVHQPTQFASWGALTSIFVFLLLIAIAFAGYVTIENFTPYQKVLNKIKQLNKKKVLSPTEINEIPHDPDGLSFHIKILLSSCLLHAKHYRDIVSALNLPVFLLDSNGTVVDMNEKMEEIIGHPSSEIIGKSSLCKFLYPSKDKNITDFINPEKPQELVFRRVLIKQRDGKNIPMGLWISGNLDRSSNEIKQYFGFLTNLRGKMFIIPPDFNEDLKLLERNIDNFKRTHRWEMLVVSESSPVFELVQKYNQLGEFLNNKNNLVKETVRDIQGVVKIVRKLLLDIRDATSEPTGRAAMIAGRIGEMAGSSEEIEESAKQVKEVTDSVGEIVEEQLLQMTQDFPLLTELFEDIKMVNNESKRLGNIILSARALLKSQEDRLWALLEEDGNSKIRRESEQFFKNQHELSSLMETASGAVDSVKADAQNSERCAKSLESELKKLNTYMVNFHGTLKRLAGLVDRLLDIADGSSWNVEDLRHEVENISSANWTSTSFIQEVLKELNRLESSLQKLANIPKEPVEEEEAEEFIRAKAA